MARVSTRGPTYGSRSEFTRREPYQHLQGLALSSRADLIPYYQDDHDLVFELQDRAARQPRPAPPRSSSSWSIPNSLDENAEAQDSTFDGSTDSPSIASNVNPIELQSCGWRPSFFRTGPLIGFAVRVVERSPLKSTSP